MQTPDGAWRVEVVKRGRSRRYRIVDEATDVTVDWFSIAAVERVLAEAGIGMADLVLDTHLADGLRPPTPVGVRVAGDTHHDQLLPERRAIQTRLAVSRDPVGDHTVEPDDGGRNADRVTCG